MMEKRTFSASYMKWKKYNFTDDDWQNLGGSGSTFYPKENCTKNGYNCKKDIIRFLQSFLYEMEEE